MARPPRLVDLHVDWPLQYAAETTLFDPALYPTVPGRLSQADGYLGATSAAVVAAFRTAEDWASRADPWAGLADLIARIEAEFCGRLLIGPEDAARWRDDPRGLCWAAIAVEGFDATIRRAEDLDRLPRLFERGVRVFQPVYGSSSVLGGSSEAGDERGLTDLGRAFLGVLEGLAAGGDGPCPGVDLAHLNPRSMADVLDWFEADGGRADRLVLLYSHGALRHDGCVKPRAITRDNLARLRALGGTIGLSVGSGFYGSPEALEAGVEEVAAIPFRGRAGCEGIALGTDYLGVERTAPGLEDVDRLREWAVRRFERTTAEALLRGGASAVLGRLAGGGRS